ncbi:ATP-binding protein [Methanohalobium sp.]|uniref:ATP-binding protein n=1 Tax=Methanohalobium sp. TaxID=2837493 RepID=UPI0025EA63EA|nr:ATP-binding protein [Methanohalobium sp.]
MLLIFLGVFLVLASSSAVIISTVTEQQEDLAYKQSSRMAQSYANEIDADMRSYMTIAKTLSKTMENYESSNRSEVNQVLKDNLINNPKLVGTYVAFEPNAFDNNDSYYANKPGHDSTGRFIPYWNKLHGNVTLDPLQDYDTLNYYQLPKVTKSEVVTEPYIYQGKLIVSFVSPVIEDGEFIGIAGTDATIKYIDKMLGKVEVFDSGYAFMVSKSGTIMTHPDKKEWPGKKNIGVIDSPRFSKMKNDIQNGTPGHIETLDPSTGNKVVMFYEPIKTGNFAVVLTVPKNEMLAGVFALGNRLIIISIISIIFMSGIAYLIARSVSSPIDKIVDDFKNITEDVINGKLDTRAETDIQIDFRPIPEGLNRIMHTVSSPVQETVNVTKQLSNGNLGARYNLDVKGDFKLFSDSLNMFAESLENIIDDSNAVLTAIQNEDFTRRVRVYGNGDFKTLTCGIENTRQSLYEITSKYKKASEDLREYTKELKKSNQLRNELAKIIESSPVVAFLWNKDGNCSVNYVSNNVDQFGYDPDDFLSGSLNYANIIHPDDLDNVMEKTAETVRYGLKEFNHEYRILTKNGEVRWVDERTSSDFDENGNVTNLRGIVIDVTDKKQAEHALIEAKMIAESANRTKNEFLANVSHELRTPLNSIIGFSELMLTERRGELNEYQKHYLNNVKNSGYHLLSLINKILDISKIEAGKMDYNPQNLSIVDLVNDVSNTMHPQALNKKIKLETIIDKNLGDIYADENKLKEALYNLVTNAIKFTPERGKVTLQVNKLDGNIRFTVKDTGIGIPEDKQSDLFKPFTQMDTSASREYGGAGLGLALVKKFIEMHNGRIWIESEVNKGTAIYFTIPVK